MTEATSGTDKAGVRGIGVDAGAVDRFRRVIERRPALLDRVFTSTERRDAGRGGDPSPRLAARFAAKEAVWKALGVGVGAVGFRDVEVLRAESGAPRLALSGRAASLAEMRGVGRWHVSLSHTDTLAVASVVAEAGATSGDAASGDTTSGDPAVPSGERHEGPVAGGAEV